MMTFFSTMHIGRILPETLPVQLTLKLLTVRSLHCQTKWGTRCLLSCHRRVHDHRHACRVCDKPWWHMTEKKQIGTWGANLRSGILTKRVAHGAICHPMMRTFEDSESQGRRRRIQSWCANFERTSKPSFKQSQALWHRCKLRSNISPATWALLDLTVGLQSVLAKIAKRFNRWKYSSNAPDFSELKKQIHIYETEIKTQQKVVTRLEATRDSRRRESLAKQSVLEMSLQEANKAAQLLQDEIKIREGDISKLQLNLQSKSVQSILRRFYTVNISRAFSKWKRTSFELSLQQGKNRRALLYWKRGTTGKYFPGGKCTQSE